MRIVSGIARGTKLYTLEGQNTRPTLDRVKESVFNIIQNRVNDCVFLDLFSGSGAIGLEAASRGAKKVVLCDKSKDAVNIIYKNIDKTHLNDKVDVYNLDFRQCLKRIADIKVDLVYLDPPYKTKFVKEAVDLMIDLDLLDNNSMIIIETDDKKIVEEIDNQCLEIIDIRKYGRAIVAFFKKQTKRRE